MRRVSHIIWLSIVFILVLWDLYSYHIFKLISKSENEELARNLIILKNYYKETIWRLENIARESNYEVSQILQMSAILESRKQELEFFHHINSPHYTLTLMQDCFSCANSIPSLREKFGGKKEYFPFLLMRMLNLTPLRRVGPNKSEYKLVFGIPTISRGINSYLIETLTSLLEQDSYLIERKVLFIVYVADIYNVSSCGDIIDTLSVTFNTSISLGIIEVICPHPNSYPPLGHLPQTLDDPPDRLQWRAKQVLDYSYLMLYAASKGDFYIQIEDDVIASNGYIQNIISFIGAQTDKFWLVLHFSNLGFIGKLFKTSDLIGFSEFLMLFYFRQPVDWLLVEYIRMNVCHITMPIDECIKLTGEATPKFNPSLFQHKGRISSLKGKKQELVDQFYKSFKPDHINPPADVSSSLSVYESFTAVKLYLNQGPMWAMNVLKDDYILIKFYEKISIRQITILTGDQDRPSDKLIKGVVQYSQEGENYSNMCEFDDNGNADCSMQKVLLVTTIRIVILETQQFWIVIKSLIIQ